MNSEATNPLDSHPGMPGATDREPDEDLAGVLVYNSRKGPFILQHLEPTPVRGPHGRKEPYRHHREALMPGLNIVSGGLWKQIVDNNPKMEEILEQEVLVEVGDPKQWVKQRRAPKIRQIMNTADVKTVEVLMKLEKDAEVIEAMEDQIEELRRHESERDEAKQRRRESRARKYARGDL